MFFRSNSLKSILAFPSWYTSFIISCSSVSVGFCPSDHDSPWLLGIKSLRLPIAHAEGKLIADDSKTLKTPGLAAAMRYPKNPNGSEQDLAAITAFDGRMLITMPHPEIFF